MFGNLFPKFHSARAGPSKIKKQSPRSFVGILEFTTVFSRFILYFYDFIIAMNLEYYLAKKIRAEGGKKNFSAPIFRISIGAIALGLAVMLLTLSIVNGFKQEIVGKIAGISGHLNLNVYAGSSVYDEQAFDSQLPIIEEIRSMQAVEAATLTGRMGGIIKTTDYVQGALFKGVAPNYYPHFLEKELTQGQLPVFNDSTTSNEVLLSSALAQKLDLSVGDRFSVYFILDQVRARKFSVSGIFNNNLEDFDQLVYCDLKHIQKLKGWKENEAGSLEIILSQKDQMDRVAYQIDQKLGTFFLENQNMLQIETVEEQFPLFFNWISLFDLNTSIIISLMLLVAIINIISGLLIMILERTQLIGILKSMGAENRSIRKIFFYQGVHLTLKGLLIGNLIGLSLAFTQYYGKWLKLNPESYYVDAVPILLDPVQIIVLNLGAALVILASLWLPGLLVARISPSRAIRFS